MARRKKHAEHENHERWLVSYADFITLLFAFFVVMYSISSVNEGKYRVLSDSLVAAFRSSQRSLQPVQVGQLARNPELKSQNVIELPRPMQFAPMILTPEEFMEKRLKEKLENKELSVEDNEFTLDQAAGQVDEIADEVEEAMDEMIAEEIISVRKDRLWLEVEINTALLFASGSAEPSLDAEIILKRLAAVLRDFPNRIHVEGFTDNQPIQSSIYPSNWELSSARAAAVVRLFAGYGIQPYRMASVGYGEYRPIADNNTETGRAMNRRVVIVVQANLEDEVDQADYGDMETMRERLTQQPDIRVGTSQ